MPNRSRWWLGLGLLVYGSVGAMVELRLLPLLLKAGALWLGGNPASPHANLPLFAPFEFHYDARPWLPWLALLLAFWSLDGAVGGAGRGDQLVAEGGSLATAAVSSPARKRWIVTLVVILLIVGLGAYTRLNVLLPQSAGLIEYPYDDEGVYAEASQLSLQGIIPYRDYFFAHPPLAAFVYAPAFAYHFTAWGSPTSFVLGRYLSVIYSLITGLILLALAAQVSGRWWVGAGAAAVWMLDGQITEINRKIMLDQPMVLLSAGALLLYLLAMQSVRRPRLLFFLAGVVVGMAALTKIAGLAAALALFSHAAITWIGNRNPPPAPPHMGSGSRMGWLTAGFTTMLVLIVGPFLLLAPGQIVREVFFFQLLRPGDGTDAVGQRMTLITGGQLPDGTLSPLLNQNPLTLILATLGVLALARHVLRGGRLGGWAVVLLWNVCNFALFTYSRSFYTHYYIQIAAPLCLLAGASLLWFDGFDRLWTSWRAAGSRVSFVAGGIVVAIVLFATPLLLAQWRTMTQARPDAVFEVVGRYVDNAVPPGTAALTLDVQFNFMAARPPSYRPESGYLVDSYGHMIYLGLDLAGRSLSDLLAGVLHDPRTSDPYPIMWRDQPQRDYLARLGDSQIVVLHDVGEGRLRADTRAQVEAAGKLVSPPSKKYAIYRISAR